MKKSMMVILGLLAMASTSLNATDLKSIARRVADNNKTSRSPLDKEKVEAGQTLQATTQKVLSALGWKDSSPEFSDPAADTLKATPKSEEQFAPKPRFSKTPEPEDEVINLSSLFNRDEEDQGESSPQAATVRASRIEDEAPRRDFGALPPSRPSSEPSLEMEGARLDLPAAPISQETSPVSSDEITRSLAETAASAPLVEPSSIVGPGPDLVAAPLSETPTAVSSDEITRSLAKAEAAGVDLAEVAASAPPATIDAPAPLVEPSSIVGPGPDLVAAPLSEAPATASSDEITRSLAKAEAAGVDLAEVAASAPAPSTEKSLTTGAAEPNLVPKLPAQQPLIMVMEDKLGPSPAPTCRKKCAWDCNVMDPKELKNYIIENYNELLKLGWIKTPLDYVEVINSDLENLNLSNNTRAVLQYMLQFILHGHVFPIEEHRLATPEEREKLLNAAKQSVEFDGMTVAEASRGIIKDTPHSKVVEKATEVFDLKNPMAQEHALDEATKVGLSRGEMIKVGIKPSKGSALSHVLSSRAPKIPFDDKPEFDHPYALPLVTKETGIGNSITALMNYIGIEVGA